MLKMVRVIAGMDAQYERHLDGLKAVFNKAFSFNAPYIGKIEAFARGEHPPGSECIILAATGVREEVLGFTVTFYFSDLKAAYLDYIASDPDRSSRGIGAALYEAMRNDVKKRGARRLFLTRCRMNPAPIWWTHAAAQQQEAHGFLRAPRRPAHPGYAVRASCHPRQPG